MKVLLACAGGMSSAIVAKALQEAATKENIEMSVHEIGSQEFEDEVSNGYDLALVAPQIRHRFNVLKEAADKVAVPIIQIKPQGYTPIGAPFVLKQIKEETNLL